MRREWWMPQWIFRLKKRYLKNLAMTELRCLIPKHKAKRAFRVMSSFVTAYEWFRFLSESAYAVRIVKAFERKVCEFVFFILSISLKKVGRFGSFVKLLLNKSISIFQYEFQRDFPSSRLGKSKPEEKENHLTCWVNRKGISKIFIYHLPIFRSPLFSVRLLRRWRKTLSARNFITERWGWKSRKKNI